MIVGGRGEEGKSAGNVGARCSHQACTGGIRDGKVGGGGIVGELSVGRISTVGDVVSGGVDSIVVFLLL